MLVPGRDRGAAVRPRRTPDVAALASAVAFRMEYAQSPEELLAAVAEQVVVALRLSAASVVVEHEQLGRLTGGYGHAVGEPMTLPLTYQGYPAGRLTVAGTRAGRPPGRRQRRAAFDVARHAGAVLHGARLTGELRQGMDRVLYAREEERRRLRHELHDGLGPILAGISLGLHAAQRVMVSDIAQAQQLVGHLEGELQSAIVEVRRLFETLRPPVLDQLGLVPAIREQIEILGTRMRTDRVEDGEPADVVFELDQADELGTLPAIVEIAAYRIVCEALTNVVRHSHASRCTVRVRREPTGLRLDVLDDGVGLTRATDHGLGLGLGSMRERAAELGGTFVADVRPDGGTRVTAVLPIQPDPARQAEGVGA